MPSHISKQQKAILLIALLGIRKLQGRKKPERKHVLAFIKIKRLMDWDEDDLDWSDAHCLVGENRISWRRKDFVEDGLIVSKPGTASWGYWELTDEGIRKAEETVHRINQWYKDDPNVFEQLRESVPVFKLTDGFFNLVLQLANNDFNKVFYPVKSG